MFFEKESEPIELELHEYEADDKPFCHQKEKGSFKS